MILFLKNVQTFPKCAINALKAQDLGLFLNNLFYFIYVTFKERGC